MTDSHWRKRFGNNHDAPLNELELDVLEKLSAGGTQSLYIFEDNAVVGLVQRGYAKVIKGTQLEVTPEGALHLRRIKEHPSTAPASLLPERVPDELDRVHAALDECGVPRSYFGAPLTADARIRLLFNFLSSNVKRGLHNKFSVAPEFRDGTK